MNERVCLIFQLVCANTNLQIIVRMISQHYSYPVTECVYSLTDVDPGARWWITLPVKYATVRNNVPIYLQVLHHNTLSFTTYQSSIYIYCFILVCVCFHFHLPVRSYCLSIHISQFLYLVSYQDTNEKYWILKTCQYPRARTPTPLLVFTLATQFLNH